MEHQARPGRPRVLLDTNIWSYVVAYGVRPEFVRLLKNSDLEVKVAPATVLEVAATNDSRRRASILRLVADPMWRRGRLATEVAGEAAELVDLIRATHPEWLHPRPRPQELEPWTRFWTREIYERAVKDPAAVRLASDHVAKFERPVAHVSAVQELNLPGVRDSGLLKEFPNILVTETGDGVLSNPAPAWAVQSANIWWTGLVTRRRKLRPDGFRNTLADWTSPFIDLDTLSRHPAEFESMWAHAEPAAAPRNWIRWATNFVQLSKRLSPSNAIDDQLASYLVDADLFLTTDRRFAAVLTTLRDTGLVAMAVPRVVPASDDRFLAGLAVALGATPE